MSDNQKSVVCDGDFPEGFDGSFGIPAQALRQANAALCDVINNRMWDVPALAERMLAFSHPQPKREPLTNEQIVSIVREASRGSAIRRDGSTSLRIARAIEAAHGIKGD